MAQLPEDPILVSSRREAVIVFFTWLIAMIWSVSYCYSHGYLALATPKDNSAQEKARVASINAERISGQKHVEVRPAASAGQPRELWVDRGNGKERVTFVLGFPSWIFFGVVLPWWICTAFSLFFGAFIVKDEDLGADVDAADDDEGREVAHA